MLPVDVLMLILFKPTAIVTCLLRELVPLSYTFTIREKTGLIVKFSAVEFATVKVPVDELIAKAPLVFPDRIEYVSVCPASGSLATTFPSRVLIALFAFN